MFGFIHCPGCNPDAKPKAEIAESIQCAWCFHPEDGPRGSHWRYVTTARNKEWRRAHNLPDDDEDDIDTSPEARSALSNPPPLPTAKTEPAPAPYKPIKREED